MLVKLFHSSAGDLNSERHSSTPKNVHVFERLPCWDMTLAGGGEDVRENVRFFAHAVQRQHGRQQP